MTSSAKLKARPKDCITSFSVVELHHFVYSEIVLDHETALHRLITSFAELDMLISLSAIAKDLHFVRPVIAIMMTIITVISILIRTTTSYSTLVDEEFGGG